MIDPSYFGLAQAALEMATSMILSAPACSYRQRLVHYQTPAAFIGPYNQPVASSSPYYNTIEGQPTDPHATVDAGTGITGGYAAEVQVNVLILERPVHSETTYGVEGVLEQEDHREGLILATQMDPARGDLIIAPDGARYVVGRIITKHSVGQTPIYYSVGLGRRDPTTGIFGFV